MSATYEAPGIAVLGTIPELTEGGQGTGDGTGSLPADIKAPEEI